MLISRRYRSNWGYQVQQDRREPIYQQYLIRPNHNLYHYDGYNTTMTFDTLTHDDIQVTEKQSQRIIKANGLRPGLGEEQEGQGIKKVAKKAVAALAKVPVGIYTSRGANAVRNALGPMTYRHERGWRPGFKGELHLPGYSWCGPGTNIDARLRRGDPGITQLDRACKIHDLDYALAKTADHVRAADMKFLGNINKSKTGKAGHKKLIKSIFRKKMRMEDRGKLSHGKFAYESKKKPTTSVDVMTGLRDQTQAGLDGETIGEGLGGIVKMIKRKKKKDPARKLRKMMKKYRLPKGKKGLAGGAIHRRSTRRGKAPKKNKAMRAALRRIRDQMIIL